MVLVALVAAISACSQSDQYLQFAAPVDVAGFIDDVTSGERAWTPEALGMRLGEPTTEVQQGPDVVLQYYGFELRMQGDTLTHIALTDSRHTAPEGIRVGYPVSQVRRLWGPPLAQEEGRWEYQTEGALLVLLIEEGIVSRVEWRLGSEGGGR